MITTIHTQTIHSVHGQTIIARADAEYYNTIISDCKQEVVEDKRSKRTQSITFVFEYLWITAVTAAHLRLEWLMLRAFARKVSVSEWKAEALAEQGGLLCVNTWFEWLTTGNDWWRPSGLRSLGVCLHGKGLQAASNHYKSFQKKVTSTIVSFFIGLIVQL